MNHLKTLVMVPMETKVVSGDLRSILDKLSEKNFTGMDFFHTSKTIFVHTTGKENTASERNLKGQNDGK